MAAKSKKYKKDGDIMKKLQPKDIPQEKIKMMGSMLLEAAQEFFADPENMEAYKNECELRKAS